MTVDPKGARSRRVNDDQPYGQLLDNATTLWEDGGTWFPGKWGTALALRRAASDPAYQATVAAKAAPAGGGIGVVSPSTLRDLVALAFDVALLVYGPSLPFGGLGVRIALRFVLAHIDQLAVPVGLRFQPS
jgi:hypothetical protein